MRIVTFLSALLTLVSADLVLYHRVYHPSLQSLRFLKRGIITLDPPAISPASEGLVHDLKTFSSVVKDLGDPPDVLYQVALLPVDDDSFARLHYSSVKACHLHQTTADTFILHLTDSEIPFIIDYTISRIPSDGACSVGPNIASTGLLALAENIQKLNTTVLLKRPNQFPLPVLRTPPALTPEGAVVQPPPQKSFLQKYWLYIVGFLLVFLVVGPEDPEAPQKQ